MENLVIKPFGLIFKLFGIKAVKNDGILFYLGLKPFLVVDYNNT